MLLLHPPHKGNVVLLEAHPEVNGLTLPVVHHEVSYRLVWLGFLPALRRWFLLTIQKLIEVVVHPMSQILRPELRTPSTFLLELFVDDAVLVGNRLTIGVELLVLLPAVMFSNWFAFGGELSAVGAWVLDHGVDLGVIEHLDWSLVLP